MKKLFLFIVIACFYGKLPLTAKEFDIKMYKETMEYYEKMDLSSTWNNAYSNFTYYGCSNKIADLEKLFKKEKVKITKVVEDFNVEKCLDGDTLFGSYFDDNFDYHEMTVRILTIDAFETHKGKKADEQLKIFKQIDDGWNGKITIDKVIEKGKEAKKFCEEYFIDKSKAKSGITLLCWKKDYFKRDLCFVIKNEEEHCYTDELIYNKLALPYRPY